MKATDSFGTRARGLGRVEGRRRYLLLYADAMGYTSACVRALARLTSGDVHVVCWSKTDPETELQVEAGKVRYHLRSGMSLEKLRRLVVELEPAATLVSGWMDLDYLRIAREIRRMGLPTVMGVDSHWTGSFRQAAGAVPLGLALRACFSHAFVPGYPQYELVRRLGFAPNQVLWNVYACDAALFAAAAQRRVRWAKRVLFAGRLVPVKRVDLAVEAFLAASASEEGWKLIIAGEGPEQASIPAHPSVEVLGRIGALELMHEAMNSSVFLHTAIHEPWGVVIHEMATAGLPLISTAECGAAAFFVKPGYNGFHFDRTSGRGLVEALKEAMALSDESRTEFGLRSQVLSKFVTPESWVAEFRRAETAQEILSRPEGAE